MASPPLVSSLSSWFSLLLLIETSMFSGDKEWRNTSFRVAHFIRCNEYVVHIQIKTPDEQFALLSCPHLHYLFHYIS